MKNVYLLILASLISTFCFSQIEFGVKGGLNLATVRYINTENSKARLGWNTGIMVQVPLNQDLFVQPELLYSSKGFGYNAIGFGNKGSVRLNYIAVPILVGFRPFNKTSFLVGPEFGFLRKAVSRSQDITTDISNSFRNFDLGIDLGVEYNINNSFGLDFRYNYGFKNLVNVVFTDQNGNITGQGKNGANRVFQVGIHYWLSK